MIRRLLSWFGVMTPEHRAVYADLCRQYGKKKRPERRQPLRAQTKHFNHNISLFREAVK